jgi:hypothetical protein
MTRTLKTRPEEGIMTTNTSDATSGGISSSRLY